MIKLLTVAIATLSICSIKTAVAATATTKNTTKNCPEGWVCPATPIYTSQIGAWYHLYWNKPGTQMSHWSEWTRYKPLQGYYSAGDPATISAHFTEMKSAGIEYVIFDHTNGIGNDAGTIEANGQSVLATNSRLGEGAQLKISVAIGYGLWGAKSLEAHNAETEHIMKNYVQSPQYMKINDKPLLIMYNSIESKDCFRCDWNDSRFTVRRAGGMIDGTNPLLQQYAGEGIWGWVIKSPQIESPEAMTVTPGWDTKHLGRATTPIERDSGAYYMKQWLTAIKKNPRNIIVASWNDWAEETSIEPGVSVSGPKWVDSYGTEVPDYYLQITSAYGNLRKGLMNGYYYKDEDNATVYLVSNGELVAQKAMPRGKPVVSLPSGTIKKLEGAAAPAAGAVGKISAGLFRVGPTLGYSNGTSYCLFDNMPNFTAMTGKTDANGITNFPSLPTEMKSDGFCVNKNSNNNANNNPNNTSNNNVKMTPGLFKVGASIGYTPDGNVYCLFDNMANFTRLTGKTDAAGIKNYNLIPASMVSQGVCKGK